MGKVYQQHDDMCGCSRCARAFELDDGPRPVFDVVDDPEVRDCGCPLWRSCDCDDFPDFDGEEGK